MSWDDWQWQLLKVVAIWVAALIAYYVCWVWFPPASGQRGALPSEEDEDREREEDPLFLPRWGSPRLR